MSSPVETEKAKELRKKLLYHRCMYLQYKYLWEDEIKTSNANQNKQVKE